MSLSQSRSTPSPMPGRASARRRCEPAGAVPISTGSVCRTMATFSTGRATGGKRPSYGAGRAGSPSGDLPARIRAAPRPWPISRSADRLAGREARARRRYAKALTIWREIESFIAGMEISRRARSSLFHLRMEAKHWDTYAREHAHPDDRLRPGDRRCADRTGSGPTARLPPLRALARREAQRLRRHQEAARRGVDDGGGRGDEPETEN